MLPPRFGERGRGGGACLRPPNRIRDRAASPAPRWRGVRPRPPAPGRTASRPCCRGSTLAIGRASGTDPAWARSMARASRLSRRPSSKSPRALAQIARPFSGLSVGSTCPSSWQSARASSLNALAAGSSSRMKPEATSSDQDPDTAECVLAIARCRAPVPATPCLPASGGARTRTATSGRPARPGRRGGSGIQPGEGRTQVRVLLLDQVAPFGLGWREPVEVRAREQVVAPPGVGLPQRC